MKTHKIAKRMGRKIERNNKLISYNELCVLWNHYVSIRDSKGHNANDFKQYVNAKKPGCKIENWAFTKFTKNVINALDHPTNRNTTLGVTLSDTPAPKPIKTEKPKPAPSVSEPVFERFLYDLSAEFIEECWEFFSRYRDKSYLEATSFSQYVNSEARGKWHVGTYGAARFKRFEYADAERFIWEKRKEQKTNTK